VSARGGGVVLYIAASLDGRIADAGGSVAWLDRYGDGAEAYGEFISGVGGILMGRATFDFVTGASPNGAGRDRLRGAAADGSLG
jgi:dihydrofolate reductase